MPTSALQFNSSWHKTLQFLRDTLKNMLTTMMSHWNANQRMTIRNKHIPVTGGKWMNKFSPAAGRLICSTRIQFNWETKKCDYILYDIIPYCYPHIDCLEYVYLFAKIAAETCSRMNSIATLCVWGQITDRSTGPSLNPRNNVSMELIKKPLHGCFHKNK